MFFKTALRSSFFAVLFAFSLPVFGQFVATNVVNGAVSSDNLGEAIACAGDVNADGFDDLIVGAPANDASFPNAGQVRVISGFDGSIIHTFNGLGANDSFGAAVDGAGDVNGDGFDDLIIGAPRQSGTNRGRAYVYSGIDGAFLFSFDGDDSNDNMGASVGGAGDVDGDGFDDVIAGAPQDDNNGLRSGSARVVSGATGMVLYNFDGDSANDFAGMAVSGAGDTNGDGFSDLLVGIWGDDDNGINSGSIRVYSGADGSVLHFILGESQGDEFGRSVAPAGDVNRDGFADIIVGAPRDDNGGSDSGSAEVISGIDGSTIHLFSGTAPSDRFGENARGAGDVNGDGYDDLIVGAPLDDNGALNSGSVFVLSGADGSTLTQVNGLIANGLLGSANAGAGDANGDGFADIAIGNALADDNGTDSGQVTTYLAPTLPVLFYRTESDQGHDLTMDWLPDNGDPFGVTGSMMVTGGTPGGIGQIGASLAPADIVIFGFLPLLIAIDPTNVILDANFGFDINGELLLINQSRQEPFLAGTTIYIQTYEISPSIKTSNGLRSLLVP